MKNLFLIILFFISCQLFGQNINQESIDSTKIVRELTYLPIPKYKTTDSGTVYLKVWIDKEGYVINAILDSVNTTTKNEKLIKSSLKASKDARFSKINIDTTCIGSIKYIFELR